MNSSSVISRPGTLREVADFSDSLESFGKSLRDWQHEIQRGGVHSKSEFAKRIKESPALLVDRFPQGDVADAYLAAYAEWLADRAGIERPDWTADVNRVAQTPWFSTPVRGRLLATAPASFRQRNIFTVPEAVFAPKAGRPPVSDEIKREKARLRQKAYRVRIRQLVEKARAAGM